MPGPAIEVARFVARENRFVVRARREGERRAPGEEVRAYLPNTARLTDVLVPDAQLILARNDDPHRRTRWTVARVWDGTWVALEAGAVSGLVADHLGAGGRLPGWPPHVRLRRERTHDGHRFDLELDLADGRTGVIEVKSLSRAHDHVAPLSDTPSTRGVAHLDALAGLAARGVPTAVVFVVQRAEVDVFDLGAPADPAWVAAVRRVRHQGVEVVAFACEVDAHRTRLGRLLEVRDSGVGGS